MADLFDTKLFWFFRVGLLLQIDGMLPLQIVGWWGQLYPATI